MNNTANGQIQTVINVKEIIWNLLEQWKAVIIAAFLMALLVAGAKYAKDMQDYDAAQAEKKVDQQNTASVEEQIDAVLLALPESERSTVMTIINQNEWIAAEKEYVNNSIVLNTDPTNQRTLVADYYVKPADDSELLRNSLISGYSSYLKDRKVAEALGKAIDHDAETKYIAELISVENSESSVRDLGSDAILEVHVVLPDDVSSKEVEETLTSLLKEQSGEMSSKICSHSIDLLSAREAIIYNYRAADNRTNILYSINSLQNNTQIMQSSLSDGQKAAIETITAIKAAEKTASDKGAGEESSEPKNNKPGISKKYALAGFILGIMIYAFIYLIRVIRGGFINSASEVEYYTQSKLLGEAYHQTEHKGIDALLHSRLVDRYRYRDKLDEGAQIQKASSKLDTLCKHAGVNDVAVLCMPELSDVKKRIIEAIKTKGLDVRVAEITKQTDEEYLLSLKYAVIIADDDSKAAELVSLATQLTDYDVNLLGGIYCKCI